MALLGYEIPEDYIPYMLCDGTNIIKIYNQTIFEQYFGKGDEPGPGTTDKGWTLTKNGNLSVVTIPENTLIILVPCEVGGTTDTFNGERAYQLKTQVLVSPRAGIIGFNKNRTIIAKCVDYGGVGEPVLEADRDKLKFKTTYIERQAASAATNRFTLTSTNFNVGDLVVYEKNNTFYTVVDKDTGWIDVDRAIDTSGAGPGYVSSMVTHIFFEGWSFDGRGNVNGLGGDIPGTGENGGAFDISYCGASKFDVQVINCAVTGNGAGFYGGELSAYLNIRHVVSCHAGLISGASAGGGVFGIYESEFKDIRFCKVYGTGGGLANCYRSKINMIYACQALNGSGNAEGGGVYKCEASDISMLIDNISEWRGGAGSQCNKSSIYQILRNEASDNGSGFYLTYYSDFTNFMENSGNKAAFNCDNSAFYGIWKLNTGGNITASNSIANIIYDDTNSKISSTQEALNI